MQNHFYDNFEFFRGFSDADASIYGSASLKKTPNGLLSFSSSWFYEVEQASYNENNCRVIQELINPEVQFLRRTRSANTQTENKYLCYRVNLAGTGKRIMSIYNQTPPGSPDRLKQYLVARVVLQEITRGKQRTAVDLACILSLLDWISTKTTSNLSEIRQKLSLGSEIISKGNEQAAVYIDRIQREVSNFEVDLKNNVKLTDDYLRGFHSGDGGLTITYQVTNDRLRFVPTWTLTNTSEALLIACRNTLKVGTVKRLSLTKPCYQFVVSGRKDFENKVIVLFKDFQLPSNYKQRQWNQVYVAWQILKEKKHLISQQDWNAFIDLTYDIAETSKRKYKKEFYYQLWSKTNSKYS